MENIQKNKSFINIIIVVVVLVLIGAGVYYYTNTGKSNTDNLVVENYGEVENQFEANTPGDIFIKRISETNKAGSFDEIIKIMEKYDSQAQVEEALNMYKEISQEQKDAMYTLFQGFFPNAGSMTNISETIDGDTAIVTAETPQFMLTAEFVKENNEWKISDLAGF